MELFPFQIEASNQIAERFHKYLENPLFSRRNQIVPFYQSLSAITGGGKTLILADTVEQMRSRLPLEPIVLWLSKGRVVVWQTLQNLATGKYSHLLGGFVVKPLSDCRPEDVQNSKKGLVLVATVGKFNQKDKEDRKIFKVGLDMADQSLWDQLKARKNSTGKKRHLIIVYDEGHNLTSQQTELLLDLQPDAIISASATLRISELLNSYLERLRKEQAWSEESFVTSVPSSRVVEAGLVKKQIQLGGYLTSMEVTVNDMHAQMGEAEKAAQRLQLPFKPKAIYVSTTNTTDDSTINQDMSRPFHQRLARPILIWRHLVERAKIDPSEIAVYCDLKFDAKFPPPSGFNLFSGADNDYDRFITGNYRHIIFNLGLQEGWDDPECSFAYIDKDMGSPEQVTQIIGRVLRQPGAQHYSVPILNTAHFYIRADEQRVFRDILDDVSKKLTSECPDITITVRKNTSGGDRPTLSALKNKTVPAVSVNSARAQKHIPEIVKAIVNFQGNIEDTVGKGGRIQVLQTIGSGEDATEEWTEIEHSNKVTARWIFLRELQKRHPKAGRLCDIELPKFDVLIEYNSNAATLIREAAIKVVDAYVEHSVIVQNSFEPPYTVDSVNIDKTKMVKFSNAVHEGYSDLNGLEREFAEALDKTKRVWCRNPSQGGFTIPLLDRGRTRNFSPDFLVWTNGHIAAIDTKGDHLIVEDAGRKLFHLEKIGNGPDLVIRLVTEGKWAVRGSEFSKDGGSGYTVWSLRQSKHHAEYCSTMAGAVQACLDSTIPADERHL